jgi:hypothetical protein
MPRTGAFWGRWVSLSASRTLTRSSSRGGRLRAARGEPYGPPARGLWPWWLWLLVAIAVFAVATLFVIATGMRPSFDPFGWLAWGHQILYGHLNLNAAPSWKPLPFLFTLPFALLGDAAVNLWSIVATAGTLAMGVFAARIVYRVSGVGPGSTRWMLIAAWVGALVAGVGVLGMEGLPRLTLVANSDQLNTALVLAAIDAHVSRRPRLAYAVLFLAALGRPEAWFMSGAYGLWMMWRLPRSITYVLGGWVAIVVCWFVPDAIWAKSITQAGQLDLGKATACHISRVICVPDRWAGLYEWPMQAAALIGVAIALIRRDRVVLGMFAFALFWLVVEIAFAYHGWSAVSRYVMEPAAVMVVIAGIGFVWLLSGLPGVVTGARASRVAAIAGPVVVVGLLVAFAPFADRRAFRWKVGVTHARANGVVNHHLLDAVALAGGRRAILRCGPVAALNQYQSQLAFAMGLNVSQVFYNPALLIHNHMRMVLFTQVGTGWQLRTYNMPSAIAARCSETVAISD